MAVLVQQEVKIKDWDFVWEVRPFYRSISIKLKPNQKMKVITGRSTKIELVLNFLEEKRTWIEKHQSRISEFERTYSREFKEGEKFLFAGIERTLRILPTALDHFFIQVTDTDLNLFYPKGGKPSSSEAAQILREYYLRKGKETVLRRAHEMAHLLGMKDERLKVKRFSIRGQTSRWGSCTSEGVVSLNWKLVAFSERVIDYVICHELAHLVHLDHSPDFWKLVAELCPDFKLAKRELKLNSHSVNFLND